MRSVAPTDLIPFFWIYPTPEPPTMNDNLCPQCNEPELYRAGDPEADLYQCRNCGWSNDGSHEDITETQTMTNADSCAFPYVAVGLDEPGLTKREYLAALAMQGMLAGGGSFGPMLARIAVEHADSLLDALDEEKTDGQ